MSDHSQDKQEQLAVVQEDAPAPEAVATGAAGPLTLPPSDEDIPAFLDRRPPSAEDQRVFDVIMAAWKIASPVVRERVRAEIIRADASRFQGRIRTTATSEKKLQGAWQSLTPRISREPTKNNAVGTERKQLNGCDLMIKKIGKPIIIAEWRRSQTEQIRVTLERFRGRNVVVLRTWWKNGKGEDCPGRTASP